MSGIAYGPRDPALYHYMATKEAQGSIQSRLSDIEKELKEIRELLDKILPDD